MSTEAAPTNYFPRKDVARLGEAVVFVWARNGRKGTGPLLEAARHENTLSGIVWEFDTAIERLNEQWLRDPAIDMSSYWSIRALKGFLAGKRELPKLRHELGCGIEELRGFVKALRDMSPLMRLYEEENDAGSGLTFGVNAAEAARLHDDNGLYRALIGGTIQVAGRYLANQLGEDGGLMIPVERGAGNTVEVDLKTVIMDALLEVPAIDGGLCDFGYFRAAREMQWYETGGPFSPALCEQIAALP